MDKDNLKEVIDNISDSIDMSDLELYRIELNDKQSVFELFFDHYFRKIEGYPFSHDKSVYVSKKINEYLMTGKNDSLQQTYREYQQKGKNIGEVVDLDKICYWCPKTIEDADEATQILFHYLCINSNYFNDKWREIIGGNKDE